jgi:hypothetical protein
MTRSQALRCCALLSAFLLYSQAVYAGAKVVAEHVPPVPVDPDRGTQSSIAFFGVGFDGIQFDNKILQTFTADQTASIDYVMFRMAGNSAGDPNPRVRIVTFDKATGTVQAILGQASIDSGTIPTFVLSAQISRLNVYADFRSVGVTLVQGNDYGILLDTATADANHPIYKSAFLEPIGPNGPHNAWMSQNSSVFTRGDGAVYFQVVADHDNRLDLLDFDVNFFYSPPDNVFDQSTFIHRIRWTAIPGRNYRVMESTSLATWYGPINFTNVEATAPMMTLDWNRVLTNFPTATDFLRYFRVEEVTP